jgi:hypothetical protein
MGKNLRLSENNLHLQVRLPRSQTGDVSSVYVQSVFFWWFFHRKHSFAEKERNMIASFRKPMQKLEINHLQVK